MSNSKILFLMSGSIAAFKACQVISKLVQAGNEVQVVATKSTFEFIGAMTLEGLTGRKVLSDIFETGHAMDHIHLTRWADFAVFCPASANTLARLAHGMSDDLVSAMALAWPPEKKFFIYPAMNQQMIQSPATQANLQTLSDRGFIVEPTQNGSLACGEEGPGRLLEAEDILRRLASVKSRGRVLITGGATREPIDGIRFISNVSTGQTAAKLCDDLAAQGWDVTFVHGLSSRQPKRASHQIAFTSFKDLDEKLRQELGGREYAAVIHAAAVGDYSVTGADESHKLASDQPLRLTLQPNFKILPRLKEYSRNKSARVIGFKLLVHQPIHEIAAVAQKSLGPAVDAVIANDWNTVNADRSKHPGVLVTPHGQTPFNTLTELSSILQPLIEKGVCHDSLS